MRVGILSLAILLMSALLSSAAITIENDDPLPPGSVGSEYHLLFSASGGLPPYKWAAFSLPKGLSMSAGGVLSGTPAAKNVRLIRGSNYATFPVSIYVVDSNVPQAFSARVLFLQINCKTSKYWHDRCETSVQE